MQQEAKAGENRASGCDAALKKGKVIDDYQRIYTGMVLNICSQEPEDFSQFKWLKTRATLRRAGFFFSSHQTAA